MATTTCSRSIRWSCGTRPPFEPAVATHADGRKSIVARGAEDDKGQMMTFIEACRAWVAVAGSLPLDVTVLIEGEEEVGSKHWCRSSTATRRISPRTSRWSCDTGMWDIEHAGDHHGAARDGL